MLLRHTVLAFLVALAAAALPLQQFANGQDAASDELTFVEQGWTDEERQAYYYIPQGSEILPYKWFMALERAIGNQPFHDSKHLAGFGFLPNAKNKFNPDGLPVGFTKSPREAGGHWVGLTCAACHTSQMTSGGATIRVDGGSNLVDILRFQAALDDSLRATLKARRKFQRFADKVLGENADEKAVGKLRREARKASVAMGNWRATSRPAHPTGFGHWDAVNILMNSITATALNEPSNYRVPQMPVSYPSIWLTSDSDRLLWNASVSSVTLRQVGEVIIVFGKAKVSLGKSGYKFETSADLEALNKVYDYTGMLEPPKWPEKALGKLDAAKIARGAKLYVQEKCAECHANKPPYPQSEPNVFGNRYIKTYPKSIDEVKTDPTYAKYFVTRTAKPGIFAPALKGSMFEGQDNIPAAILFLATLTALTDTEIAETAKTKQERTDLLGGRPLPTLPKNKAEFDALVKSLLVYKAAPLPGVWASAPYLHNGSVPNLYELLLPASQRSKSFTLGNREFDAKRVGYQTKGGGYRYDTTLPGYSNQGHEYGAKLSDEDRWALVEYLKSL